MKDLAHVADKQADGQGAPHGALRQLGHLFIHSFVRSHDTFVGPMVYVCRLFSVALFFTHN